MDHACTIISVGGSAFVAGFSRVLYRDCLMHSLTHLHNITDTE